MKAENKKTYEYDIQVSKKALRVLELANITPREAIEETTKRIIENPEIAQKNMQKKQNNPASVEQNYKTFIGYTETKNKLGKLIAEIRQEYSNINNSFERVDNLLKDYYMLLGDFGEYTDNYIAVLKDAER